MRGHNENVSALFIMTGILYQNSRERSEHLIWGGKKKSFGQPAVNEIIVPVRAKK